MQELILGYLNYIIAAVILGFILLTSNYELYCFFYAIFNVISNVLCGRLGKPITAFIAKIFTNSFEVITLAFKDAFMFKPKRKKSEIDNTFNESVTK
tara:strand:+ start:310 stop:600 length:291 start_codon:yes stop_codon:yes gene_type:complete